MMPTTRQLSNAACRTLAIGALLTAPAAARVRTYAIDPGQSTIDISVGKSGVFGVFGHSHSIRASGISGRVTFDALDRSKDAVTFAVAARSLAVLDPGESDSTRQEVQATMLGPGVLDVEKFPEITFTSSSVTATKASADDADLVVNGVLSVHGVERPLALPVHVHADADTIRATATATIKQTDFGITPVTAGGGTVRVKNDVTIAFDVVARAASAPR